LSGDNLTRLPRSSTWLATLHGVVEASNLVGDQLTAAAAYELLSPFAKLPIMAGLGVACFGSVHHSLGVASLSMGNVDAAVYHFRAARNDGLAIGHLPAAVLSRGRLVEALNLRAGAGDAIEARDELDAARTEAHRLQMQLPQQPGRGAPVGVHTIDPKAQARLQRRGRQWLIELGGRTTVVEHSIGMGYLAVLFANPGREVASAELVAGPAGLITESPIGRAAESHQPVLDEAAMKAFRQRLSELRKAIDSYDATGDVEGSMRAHAESGWLISELSAAAGLGGRSRGFNTAEERARVSVGKAIRRALNRISRADPMIGARLHDTVQTGRRCCYQP
jgi:hypothetical protein